MKTEHLNLVELWEIIGDEGITIVHEQAVMLPPDGVENYSVNIACKTAYGADVLVTTTYIIDKEDGALMGVEYSVELVK